MDHATGFMSVVKVSTIGKDILVNLHSAKYFNDDRHARDRLAKIRTSATPNPPIYLYYPST